MTDPKILAEAIKAAAQAEEQRQAQLRAKLGDFVGKLLLGEPTRDEQGSHGEGGRNA